MTTPINRLVYFAWISGVFSILFGYLTTGSYVAWLSGVFCIPFGYLTTGSYVAWISGVFSILFGYLTTRSYVAWISGVFCIPFGYLTIGSYDAWISGVFSILFGYLTTGSYDAWISGVFLIKRWSEAESFTYKSKSWLHPLIDCFNLRENLEFFSILFCHLSTGSYNAWKSGVFLHTFLSPNYRVI